MIVSRTKQAHALTLDPTSFDFQNTPASDARPAFHYRLRETNVAPYVTIITPFFNTGPVFHETARSVLRQSFQEWEWLIVNDASTDSQALAVLDAFRQADARIRVLDHASNRGPGAARNTAVSQARADFIVQLDSDNLLEPTAIEVWLWFLESYPEYAFVKGFTVGFGAEEYLWTSGFHDGPAFLYANQVDATAMIRKKVYEAVGGYDQSIRDGLEDWDFWLRCADAGYWGQTIPQFCDWYRRRAAHSERWKDWDEGRRQRTFLQKLRGRYPSLWQEGFPQIQRQRQANSDTVRHSLPVANALDKEGRRLLLIVPWLAMGGSDKFNLNLVAQLHRQGWEVTVATTLEGDHSRWRDFAAHTPDIFALPTFLDLADYPRFLRYLAQSRQVDCMLVTHSELGYQLLPYLRAHLPQVTFVDYCHIVEEQWKNGGYPRLSLQYQEALDLQIVSSRDLQQWMIAEGAAPQRVRLCYTGTETPTDYNPEDSVPGEQWHNGKATPHIVYAGRICAQKQPHVFARTMRRLAQHGLSFYVTVAGDGPDLPELQSFVNRHGLSDHVRFLGALPFAQMQTLLEEADIFFLPSQAEGISLAIYEAMAAGLAVVGANVGGQSELVAPGCGLLVARGSEDEEVARYTEALTFLLRQPQLVYEMGQAAQRRIMAHFQLEQMGERMVALLADARRLHHSDPRPQISSGLARTMAQQVVEYHGVSRLAERLWMERHGHRATHPGDKQHLRDLGWSKRLYLTLYRWHEPIYHWYMRRGWTWLTPLRNRIKSLLLRPS